MRTWPTGNNNADMFQASRWSCPLKRLSPQNEDLSKAIVQRTFQLGELYKLKKKKQSPQNEGIVLGESDKIAEKQSRQNVGFVSSKPDRVTSQTDYCLCAMTRTNKHIGKWSSGQNVHLIDRRLKGFSNRQNVGLKNNGTAVRRHKYPCYGNGGTIRSGHHAKNSWTLGIFVITQTTQWRHQWLQRKSPQTPINII